METLEFVDCCIVDEEVKLESENEQSKLTASFKEKEALVAAVGFWMKN